MGEAGFFSEAFMPHGHCYFWLPSVLWTHVLSDAAIALSYYSIPLALVTLVRRRKDLAFGWVFLLFGAFIFLCGTTHLVSIWTTWNPAYGAEGVVKAATAVISLGTAVAVWPLLPRALALPSASDLVRLNAQREAEIERRAGVERELRALADELEARVRSRTEELAVRADELARSNRELESFAYVVSHDLKSPLRAVATLVDVLSADLCGAPSPEVQTTLQLMRERIARLVGLVDGVLRYSRAGVTPQPEALSPSSVAREVCAALDAPPGIRVEIADDMPEILYDRGHFVQVVQNLVANAFQHMGVESGRVAISAQRRGARVVFSVEDDGAGIDPAHHERIFRMFQTLRPGGSGVGLAIVQKIVEQNGGTVSVASAPGRGARFEFSAAAAPPRGGAPSA